MIHIGRHTAQRETPVTLFLLGMRIHNVWAIRKWARIYRLIPRIFQELEREPDLGYLGGISRITFRQPLIVQYWDSPESLAAYARAKDRNHLPVWREFNQVVGKSPDIGIWHETYVIQPQQQENIYINMPFTGLGQFTPLEPVGKRMEKFEARF